MKTLLPNGNIQEYESIKELFIFDKKDKTPANMLLRLSSYFEQQESKKEIKHFIENNKSSLLADYFITE